MVEVYFEMNSGYAQHVATFNCEQVYNDLLPDLERVAKKHGFTHVTESIEQG